MPLVVTGNTLRGFNAYDSQRDEWRTSRVKVTWSYTKRITKQRRKIKEGGFSHNADIFISKTSRQCIPHWIKDFFSPVMPRPEDTIS